MSKGLIMMKDMRFNKLKSEYQLKLDKDSIVQLASEQDCGIPYAHFNFERFRRIKHEMEIANFVGTNIYLWYLPSKMLLALFTQPRK